MIAFSLMINTVVSKCLRFVNRYLTWHVSKSAAKLSTLTIDSLYQPLAHLYLLAYAVQIPRKIIKILICGTCIKVEPVECIAFQQTKSQWFSVLNVKPCRASSVYNKWCILTTLVSRGPRNNLHQIIHFTYSIHFTDLILITTKSQYSSSSCILWNFTS